MLFHRESNQDRTAGSNWNLAGDYTFFGLLKQPQRKAVNFDASETSRKPYTPISLGQAGRRGG
jgi:hypothetical protein